ncbi:histone-lysine N-methyltransferase ash1 isoform X2 [Phlebotomus papatasi]|nr:histone-lysine N-methyltransferase ash1 isoform X2 [Phlebotomus papatasi]
MDSSSSSSDSDGTSSSSESDSSTSSGHQKHRKSPTQAPQFSVTSSDKSGLKMKIAAIPRGVNSSQKALNNNSSPTGKANDKKKAKSTKANVASTSKKSTTDASSTSSCCSACNGSESDSSSDENTNNQQKSQKKQKKLRRKKANRSASTSSGGRTDSSDSESSDEVLQEINPEDLAAILPSENFNEFDAPTTTTTATTSSSAVHATNSATLATHVTTTTTTSTRFGQQTKAVPSNVSTSLADPCVDGGSSSDMELPAIVSAAIQLVENCSDSEAGGGKPVAPPVTYNSPLLLDFMVKTQMLGKSSTGLDEAPGKDETKGMVVSQVASGTGEKGGAGAGGGSVGKVESESQGLAAASSVTKVSLGAVAGESKENVPAVDVKRKRGRPKKNPTAIVEKVAAAAAPSVAAASAAKATSGSPDSGILSITQSPSHSPKIEGPKRGSTRNSASVGSAKKIESVPVVVTRKTPIPTTPTKINIASLDKSMYATERVLYPPRGRKRGPGRPPNKSKEAKKEESVDPAWKKIDINKKFRRPSVSGYKSDGGTVCSKVLASQCGYTSDYGAVRRSRLSGYRSDYSTKSKKSGYRSDYSVKAKSCGYRSDCSIRHRKKVRRKRRTKTSHKSAVTEQDILQLAGLSLGQSSEENSLEAPAVAVIKPNENLFAAATFNGAFGLDRKLSLNPTGQTAPAAAAVSEGKRSLKSSQNHSFFAQASNSKMSFKEATRSRGIAGNSVDSSKKLTDFVGRVKSLSTFGSMSAGKSKGAAKKIDDSVCSFGSFLQQQQSITAPKVRENSNLSKSPARTATIRSRRSSAVSRCSSRSARSTMSRHHLKRRRRKRLRSRNESVASRVTDSKFLQELDQLIATFTVACHISANDKNPTKEVPPKTTSKRSTKKRKVTETADSPSTSVGGGGSGGKRRHKKAQSTQSPDDHKLPLKKRHYLLAPGERSESKLMAEDAKNGDSGKMPPRAVTPKKRHLIEKQDPPSIITNEISSAIKSSNSPITIDTKTTDSSEVSVVDSGTNLRSRRSDIVTRKKNRLEGLVSKMQASPSGESSSGKSHPGRPSVISKIPSAPPPGVFEPSIDLELQIPVSTIVIPSLVTKTEALDSPRVTESIGTVDTNESLLKKTEKVVETLLSKTTGQLSKRKRRKAINRTGFPSVKKRKKIAVRDNTSELSWNGNVKEVQASPKVQPLTVENVKKITENCDRVPKIGETADTFVERNTRPRLSVVSLEKLQGKIPEESSSNRMVVNPFGLDRKTRKSVANGEIADGGKRQLRTRNRDENEVKKRDRDSSQDSGSISTIAKKLKEEETAKGRDLSSDNEPLINLVKTNERKRTRRKGASALIDNLTPNEVLPDSAKRTRLQSEIEKKNKLEAEMQPVVKLESMEGSAGIILSKRTASRASSAALLSSSSVDRSPRPKSRMELKLSPLVVSRETSKESTKGGGVPKEMSLKVSLRLPQERVQEMRKDLPKEVSKVAPKEAGKVVPKEATKVATKEATKVTKDATKIVPKEPTKVASKEQTKVTTKEATKFTAKEATKVTTKEATKVTTKEATKVTTKEATKVAPKEVTKVAPKEPIKVATKELSKVALKESSKVAPKEPPKVASKEPVKVAPKEPSKITPNELLKELPRESERASRYKRANSIAGPLVECPTNLTGATAKVQEKDKQQPEKEKAKERTVKTKETDREKDKERSHIKTRTTRDKSTEKKSVDIDEISLAKRQQTTKVVPKIPMTLPKKMEKEKPQQVQKDANVQELIAKIKTPEVRSKSDGKSSTNTPVSPQMIEELEQEPLPINEGPLGMVSRDESPVSVTSEKSGKKFSRWKKKYLNAGLLSDTYKEDDGRKHNRGEDSQPQMLLPPPPYCERFFRKTQRDFLLPYDLWWAHENQKLPCRNSVPSWNYKKIRTNVYIDVRANPRTDQPSCSCKPDSGCGEDCLNRVVYTECSTETCPCGDKCQNTKIQRHEYSPGLERYMTPNKGWGVRTRLPIRKGNFILEYVGEVVTEREFKDRMATLYVRDTHHYCLHLDGGLVIDGHRMGSDGRFVNHSCAPNCEMQKWSVNGLPRMVLFAARDIKAGEELTYDYNFALFNPAEGQPCLCESSSCRGVIGGKSQRIKPMIDQQTSQSKSTSNSDDNSSRGRSRKRTAKKNQFQNTGKDRSGTPLFQVPTNKELVIIKESHCFLMRNLGKIRRLKERLTQQPQASVPSPITLLTRITELRVPRNIRTRGLTVGDHDPQIDRMAKMAAIFKDLCRDICSFKESGPHPAINKLALPAKKKLPQYYETVTKPIDMGQIELNVERGVYKNPATFDDDIQRLFKNALQFYSAGSDEAKAAQSLLTLFTNKKQLVYEQLLEIVDDKDSLRSYKRSKINELVLKAEPNEDVIQCICGLFKDEGLMIQCSDCQVWQHTECTKADTEAESYRCEKCDPRPVNLEIPLEEFTDEGYRYYLSLLRGDLHVRQSDTVYVLRDIPMSPDPKNPNLPPRKHTYETIGDIDYNECDIFRVERLWKDNNGKRFVFGHHYLRPHETYHEPTRKFYPNEVVRVPLYEVVPIELIMARCWVLDPATYCKGRPVDSDEAHIYICELRVDKGARLFAKVSKQAYPICTKSYAFRKFEQKLKISRTYAPHDLGPVPPKPKKRKEEVPIASRKNSTSIIQLMPPPPKTLNEKRSRLEDTLTRLMNRLKSTKPESLPAMDLSYLLTGRGARQRRANATSVPV